MASYYTALGPAAGFRHAISWDWLQSLTLSRQYGHMIGHVRDSSNGVHDVDLIVRNGLVVDGTGRRAVRCRCRGLGRPYRCCRQGACSGTAREIDAQGLVRHARVRRHSHALRRAGHLGSTGWFPRLPHGVTTVVMGNCGVGFAPAGRISTRCSSSSMEGVEDIPHPVLVDGLPWTWESYPEYLDFLATRRYDADICGYVPHAPVRVYVMGQRGADREPATDADLRQMARIVREAVRAGAMGFSTSRTFFHRSSDGKSTPSFEAAENELTALALALKESGKGVDAAHHATSTSRSRRLRMLRRLVERSGRPLSVSLLEGAYGPMTLALARCPRLGGRGAPPQDSRSRHRCWAARSA